MRQVTRAAARGKRGGCVLAGMALLVAMMVAGCATATGSGGASGAPTSRGPTATPTAEQRVAAVAQRAAGTSVQSVTASFGAGGAEAGMVTLNATVGGAVPGTEAEIAASQERVKAMCFRMEQALWTSGMPLREVTVEVVGPIYDDYADLTTGAYGAVDLKAATAATLDWSRLTPDTAWTTYGVWLRPAYRSKVLGQ